MLCVRALLLISLSFCVTHAFFFNFKGSNTGKETSRRPPGKYPSVNPVPTHYGAGGFTGGSRPNGGYQKPQPGGIYRPISPPVRPLPKPITTYGPPSKPVVPIRPTTTYGPPKATAAFWSVSGGDNVVSSTSEGTLIGSGGAWGNGASIGSAEVAGGQNGGWDLGGSVTKSPPLISIESSTGSSGLYWNNVGASGAKEVGSNGYYGQHLSNHHASNHGKGEWAHHTHFHSHYHTSFADSWSAVTASTASIARATPRTVTFQQQASVASYLPRQIETKPVHGQSSHKVVTFIKPAPSSVASSSDAEIDTPSFDKQEKSPSSRNADESTPESVSVSSTPQSTSAAPDDQKQSASDVKPRKARSLTDALVSLHLSKFLSLVKQAGIQDVFQAKGGFTVFAFSNDAWQLLPGSTRAQLVADSGRLRDLLLHHVTPTHLSSRDFADNVLLQSASRAGSQLRINVYQLQEHQQRVVTVNGARVQASDDSAQNGAVHVIDSVLLLRAERSALDFLSRDQCADLNFQAASKVYSRLNLSHLLSTNDPITVFLPISSAFSIPDTITSDLANSSLSIQNMMLYHVVPGTYYSAGLRDGQWLPTMLDGQELQMQVVSDGYSRRVTTVSKQAQVIQSDIPVANGVVHIIDFLLRPDRNLQQCTQQ